MGKGKLTKFEKKVLKAICRIPYGETRSYSWVAERVGNSKAVRAVGRALGSNPYTVVVPCHRVIRKDGSLGGFSAKGGVKLKRKLIEFEKSTEGSWEEVDA